MMSPSGDSYGGKVVATVVVVSAEPVTVVVAATSLESALQAVVAMPSESATLTARAIDSRERGDCFSELVWGFSSQVTL
jgi:hypothetical protein